MSTRSRQGKARPRPFPWQPTAVETVAEFQPTCTICEFRVRWLTWDDAIALHGGDWLYEQRALLYAMVGEDLVTVEVWSCCRNSKHYGITAAARSDTELTLPWVRG